MPTRQEIEAKLAAIDQKKAEALKTLQAQRVRLKAKLAALERPSKSQRRLDARRKILVGAFVLEQLEHAGLTAQALTFQDKRFADWLVRPNDRAVFEFPTPPAPGAALPDTTPPPSTPRTAPTDTPLNVTYDDKDQVKALGAHWRPETKTWFVPAGRDLTPFQPWLE